MYKIFFIIVTLLTIMTGSGVAQSVTNYSFASTTGTFTILTGATSPALSSGNADEGIFNNIPVGFDFFYLGTRYTTVSASTNGWLTFSGAIGLINEATSLPGTPTVTGVRPVLAPLWDDLSIQAATNFSYNTTGAVGSRIFTIQYLNVKWSPAAAGASISFQVKLYETSGKIEFCYRPEASAIVNAYAAIGITALATGSGNFLSVNGSGTSVSSATEAPVTTRPASGQTYSFVSPVPAAPSVLTFSGATTTSVTLKWNDNSLNEIAFAIYRSIDGINFAYVNQVSPVPDSSVQTGLTVGTTYYWRVYAVTEGGLSAALSGTQATLTCAAAAPIPSGTSIATCVGGSTGTITASASGGAGPYTFSLNAGTYQISTSFTGLTAGTYTLNAKTAEGCIGSVSIVVSNFANSTDNINATGTNTWIGHMYDAINFASYIGQFTEAETFNEVFGGALTCFNVTSNSTTRSIYTETFSVKYKMASTKKGLYVVDLGSDDGSRLTVDGTMVYNNWVAQTFTSRPAVLFSLNGASSLLYEFFEQGSDNRVVFQNLTLVLANSLAVNTTQNICIGGIGSAISGDVYGTLPAGVTLSGTGYQWSYSTTPGGTRTDITGATGATFTPSTSVAPFNAGGTYYVYRKAVLSSTNNVSPNPYTATNESNAAIIIISSPVASGTSTLTCVGGSTGTITASASGGAVPFTYSLNGGAYQVSASFSGLAAGSFLLNAKDNNGCVGSTSVVVSTYAISTDNQNATGTNTWIGHMYDAVNFTSYIGQFTEAETFNETFGGSLGCFNVTSNSTTRSIYTETFSVKYKMASTKKGLYVVDLGSDDGSRLTVDGTMVYNNWVPQGFIIKPSVLLGLTGTSSLLYEFYEDGGGNQVAFQNLTLVLGNTLSTNTTQAICMGSNGSAISGDVYGTLPAGVTLSGTGYQWSYSTTPGGTRTDIAGATAALFTPSTSAAPFNAAGVFYVYRKAILSSINNVSPNPYVGTSESNAATITISPSPAATIAYALSPYCINGSAATVSLTGTGGGTYSSTAGLSLDVNSGAINTSSSSVGTYTVSYTVAASGGCNAFVTTASVQILALIQNNKLDFTNGAHGVLCATVGEGGTASLTAPAGSVFINVAFASYGNPTGLCGAFTLGNCSASSSQTIAESYLLGNNSGNILATNTVFGDPCLGTAKALYIAATYTQPVCAGTSPGTITGTDPSGGSGTYVYLWEMSTTSSTSGFTAAPGTNNTRDYIPGNLTQSTWFKRQVISGSCTDLSKVIRVSVTPLPAATISYSGNPFCSNTGTANVTRTGTAGGTFTSAPGLSVNAATGEIILATSTAGTYTVTYTIAAAGGCAAFSTTAPVTISTAPLASISYTGSPFCSNAGTVTGIRTGTGGGIYSSSVGLSLDATTGAIILGTSIQGTYTITYTIAASGGCSSYSATTNITISAAPAATISYAASPYCKNAGTALVTLSGTTGGTYSSTAGLVISATTGDITLASSTAGTYTITYTMVNGACTTTATTVVVVTALPVSTFSYTGGSYCKNAANPLPTFSGGGAAGTFSSAGGLVFVSNTTGEVNLASSTAGTYTVTNTRAAAGGCPIVTATSSITITTVPVLTFNYTGTPYCKNAANPLPTFTGGGAAAVFSSTAGLVFVSTATGEVDLALSTAGTYTVTNKKAASGGCGTLSATSSITITAVPVATIAYNGSPYCSNVAPATVTFSGTTGGVYSSTTGLFINATTGEITVSASTAGNYIVTYSINGGGCSFLTTANVSIIAAPAISQVPALNLVASYPFNGDASDATGNGNGTLQNGPALTTDRFNIANKAYSFNGSSQYISTARSYTNPSNFSISIWFKTTTTTGGKLMGFGVAQTGQSNNYDRHLYMSNTGQVYFGVYNGAARTVNSAVSYNDGKWHLATASLSATTGMVLYMDGLQVGTSPAAVSGENFTGYWKIGFDNLSGWVNIPSSYYFNGSLDDVLIYQRVLTPPEVAALYKSPDGAGNNGPVCVGTTLTLTATSAAGATYAWTGPNGFTSSVQNPAFVYTAINAGVYTLTATAAGCTSTAYTNVVSGTSAGEWTGNVSTDWADANNWCSGAVPTSATNVTITAGATRMPSVISSVLCNNLTINAGATVTNTGTGNLQVAGTITNNGTYTDNGITTFNGTSGQQTFTGITTFNSIQLINSIGLLLPASVTIKNNVTISTGTLTGNNYNISVAGSWFNNSSLTAFAAGTGVVNFNGSAAQTIGGTFATTFNNLTIASTGGSVALNQNVSLTGNLLVSGGTFDLSSYTTNRASAGGSLSLSNNTILKIGGTNTFPVNYTTNTLAVASTVEYSGTNQTIGSQVYGNLKLSSSGGAAVKTLPATPLTIVGNLISTLGAGTSVSFTAGSNITVSGNVSIGAATAFNGGSYSHNIAGSWANAGTFNGNTSTITFTGSGSAVSGSGTQNFNNLTVAASGITFSSAGVTLTGNLATIGSGSFVQASGGSLTMTGSGKTISGSGISLDNLSVSGTVTTLIQLNLGGNLSVSGSFMAGNGTVIMSGSSKTISGAGTITFYDLNPTGSITANTNFTISSGLVVGGSFSAAAGTATFTGTSSFSGTANLFNVAVNGTSLKLSTGSVLGIANILTLTSGVLDVTSSPNTVIFNGTGTQNVNGITYSNLILSNGSTKTPAGAFTANDITIGTGTTLSALSYTHGIYGNWTNNGFFTAGTGAIEFLGPTTATITGATTFNILTSNTSSSTTELILQSNVSAEIVNMTRGIISTGSNTLTITNTRNGNGYIYGNIRRTHAFTTGTPYAFEGPDNTVTFSAVSAVSSITVSVVKGTIGDFPFGGSISRVYNIGIPSGTYTATLRLHYEDVELNGNTESSMALWHYDGSLWGPVGKTGNNTTLNYIEQSGLTNITNRWTASDNSNLVRWNGSVSTDWNTAGNWTVLQGSASAPPSASDIVDLGSATFNNQPTITNSVTVKNIVFGSAKAVTLTLASGGSLITSGDINGNWTANATHTINVNYQSLVVNGNLDLSDGTNGHSINLNIGSGTVTTFGSLTQSGGSNIAFSGAGTLNIFENFNYSSGVFTAATGTVTYDGDQNQVIASVGYNDLTINKTGGLAAINDTVSIAGNLLIAAGELDNFSRTSIAGNVTISAGSFFNNYNILHVQGNWNNNGTYTATGASIYFDGIGAQSISASTFNNLNINKPSGTAVITGDIIATGDFNITSGTFDFQTYNVTRNVLGGTATIGAAGIAKIGGNNGPVNFGTKTIDVNSTVIYNGSSTQYISSTGISFGNVIFRNGGGNPKLLITSAIVKGNLTIENNATLDAAAYTILLEGNWINNGAFTASASTVLLNGIGKTVTGNTTFNNVAVKGTYTLLDDITVDSTIMITTTGGIYNGVGRTVTLNGDLTTRGTYNIGGASTFAGTRVQTITAINATTSVFIQNYNGAVSPVINSTSLPQFQYLNINNTGGVNPKVKWVVHKLFTVGTGGIFNGGISSHDFFGDVTNNGTITSTGTLTFRPATAATVNLGNNFSSTGRVYFGGAGALTLLGNPVSFYNVNINNTNVAGITPSSVWNIQNDLRVVGGSLLNAGNFNHLIGGNISSEGTINSATSTFTLNGTGNQDIFTLSDFNNLTIDKTAGITILSSNVSVNGSLNFVAGKIQTGSNNMVQPSAGTVSGAAQSTGWVYGNFKKNIASGATTKLFEVGDGLVYSPVAIAFSNVITPGNLTASATAGDHPGISSSSINPLKSVNRYWTLLNDGIVYTDYSATYNFIASDIDGGSNTSAFGIGLYNGSSWGMPAVTSANTTNTTATGVISTGDFAIGEVCNAGASVAYIASPYCTSGGTASATLTGTSGGSFTSSAGLSLDAVTGAINLSLSTPGNYIITYTIAAGGGCPVYITTATVTITAAPAATIAYEASPYCISSGNAAVTFTGTPGGVYSSTPGLSVNSATGAVNIAASTAGIYIVTYTIAASGGCAAYTTTATIQVSGVIANNYLDYTNGAHGVICSIVNEGGTAVLTAPPGTNFTSVGFASYGNPGGSCSAFTIGNCHALNSVTIAESYLLGKNSAGIPATNGIFGDPCNGTVKQFKVQATYTQPICIGTTPGTITGTSPSGGNAVYAYLWEESITSAVSGFGPASGINNTRDFTPGTLTQTTWYRRTVISAGCANISGVIVVVVTPLTDATISYAGSPYCSTSGSVAVTVSGSAGGTFSSAPGLSINASTGSVNTNSSTAGAYTVTYTVAPIGGCAQFTTTASITINAAPFATGSYPGSPYCSNSGVVYPSGSGTGGGTFSSTPGLNIDLYTGGINTGASTPGTYAVTYTVAASAGCPAFSWAANVIIVAAPSATGSYTGSPYCTSSGTVYPSGSGTGGGTFSSTTGLSIDQYTGGINTGTSTPGTYVVTYTIPASGVCAAFSWTTNVMVTAPPLANINYAGNPFCSNTGTAAVTRTGAAGGVYSSTTGLSIDTNTGLIDLAASSLGDYTVTYTIAAGGGCPQYQTSTVFTRFAYSTTVFAQAPNLGTAAGFVLFTVAGAAGNTANSVITGDIGTHAGAINGFGTATVNGSFYNSNSVTQQCSTDLLAAYNHLDTITPTSIHGPVLGNGETLYAGVYSITGAASASAVLNLDAQGNPNAVFIIKIGGAFNTSISTTVNLVNGASAANVYWKAEGEIAIGASNIMKGTLIANSGAISLGEGGSLEGRMFSTGGAASFNQSVASIPATVTAFWTGTTGTDWYAPCNWLNGITPTHTVNATIPSGLTNYPVLNTGTGNAQNVTIHPGATLNVSGATLQIAGTISNAGVFDASAGSINLNGASPQIIPANTFINNTIFNLVINNNVTLGGATYVTGVLTLASPNKTLATGDMLTLKSTASGTARVAPLPVDASGFAISYISGNVSVERYIPSRRAWRLLTSPLSVTGNVYNSWQNAGIYEAGKGTLVTGPNPSPSNGLDASIQNSVSMKTFNVTTQDFINTVHTKTWQLSNNTGNADNIGYLIFVRGDRNPNNTNLSHSNATTLKSTGLLQTGKQVFAAASGKDQFTIMGNPYASPIDFNSIHRTRIMKRFYAWDPALNQVGGYVTLDDLDGDGLFSKSVPASSQDKNIQSGQAFFVQTDTAGAASLTYYESSKSNTVSNVGFRPVGGIASLDATLNLLDANNGTIVADAFLAEFHASFNAGVDLQDASKLGNTHETFSLLRNRKALAIERRPLITAADTLFFKLSRTTARNYQFFIRMNDVDPLLMASLEDKFTGVSTPLNMNAGTHIDFSITSNVASAHAERFMIVFKPTGVLPVSYSSVTARQRAGDVDVSWKVEQQLNIKHYEVEKSVDGRNFVKVHTQPVTGSNTATYNWLDVNAVHGDNYYRIRNIDQDGSSAYSKIVKVNIEKLQGGMVVYPNPVTENEIRVQLTGLAAGSYSARLLGSAGQVLLVKTFLHAGGNGAQAIELPQDFSKGIYRLEVVHPGGVNVTTISVMKQ